MARLGRARGGRITISRMGDQHHTKATTKWLNKMKKNHPAEYEEAMRRLEARKDDK